MRRSKSYLTLGLALLCLWLILPGSLAEARQPLKTAAPALVAPEKSEGEDIADWQARWELARLLSYIKKYDESLKEYARVLKEKPDLLEAKMEMGQVYFWSGQPDKALEILAPIPPEKMNDQIRGVLADLYGAQKKYDQAQALYRTHLERFPQDLEVRLKLAELLSWSKRYKESLAEYETILKARPDDIQVRRKYALVLSWAGRRAEAIAELRRTIDRKP